MPLDPNIILQAQQPQIQNPLDAMSKIMAFKALASRGQLEGLEADKAQRANNDDTAMRSAYARNTSIDPSGSASLNRAGVLSDLAKTSPHLLPNVQQNFASMDYEIQNQKMKSALGKIDFGSQVLNSVTDQKTYDNALAQMQSVGIPTDQFTRQYDPKFVASAQAQALSYKDKLTTQIEQQKAQNEGKKLDVELYKTFGRPITPGSGSGSKTKSGAPIDPATLVSGTVPPDRQAKVFDEIGAAQNTAKNAPAILQAYDNAVKKIKSGLYTPESLNPDIAALQVNLGPTFKDVEGTVRQAAMDNVFGHTTPTNTDRFVKDAFAKKRQALLTYLQSKSSAPTAMGYGIDLSKYPSTSLDPKILVGGDKRSSDGGKTAAPSGPKIGTIVGDHKFLGGNPNDANSWAPMTAGK